MFQIVGSDAGVAHLLKVDSDGKLSVKDSVVEASLSSMEAKMDVDNAVFDLMKTKLDEIEVSADALISANHTDLVALENSLTSMEAKQDDMEVSLNAIQSAVEGTLSVSAPAVSTTSAVLKNVVSVADSTTETSSSVDLNDVKKMSIFGSLDDSTGNIVVEVSADDSTFFEKSDEVVYINGSNHFNKEIEVSARYIRFKYSNDSGSSKLWTLHSSYKK
jgi:uncharacterized protein YhaN